MYKRREESFRTVIDVKDIDACFAIENIEKFPLFSRAFEWFKTWFPGMYHKCPYTVIFRLSYFKTTSFKSFFKSFKLINASLVTDPEETRTWHPNGFYKSTIRLANEIDNNILTLIFYNEVKTWRRNAKRKN